MIALGDGELILDTAWAPGGTSERSFWSAAAADPMETAKPVKRAKKLDLPPENRRI
jgi:hypothetical protein